MTSSAPLSANPVRAVIFDLDGTLVDSAAEIAAALNAALLEAGLPAVPDQKVQAMIGRGVRVLVERALGFLGSHRDVEEVVKRFQAHYAKTVGSHAQLFPGVLAGLERLAAARVPLAVVTNKPRHFTERLLERLEVDRFFGTIVAGDDGVPAKPSGDMLVEACRRMRVEPGAALMVGDSDNDVRAAREAGCRIWCVPYGYNEGRAAETLACERLVPTVDEIARHVLQEV